MSAALKMSWNVAEFAPVGLMKRCVIHALPVVLGIALSAANIAFANSRLPHHWLQEYFGSQRDGAAMRVMNQRESVEVEICLDQCDIFRRSKVGGMPEEKFWELVFLFEYSKGVGTDYDAFRKSAAGTAADLTRSNPRFCREQSSDGVTSPPSCAWQEWATSLRTRIGQSTYDEKLRCVGWRTGRTFSVGSHRCSKVYEIPWGSRK